MGEFRDRMDQDMQIRGYSLNTRKVYLSCVHDYVGHYMKPPDELGLEEIRRFQLHLTRDREVSFAYFNQTVCALRFFYNVTLDRKWDIGRMPYQKRARRLPEILSQQEVAALLGGIENLKHRVMLMMLYAGGLRVSEMLNLRVSDIDSRRMMIRIEQAKGRKDRYVMLSEELLKLLRAYWRVKRPPALLLTEAESRVMRDIVNCRTAALGGHMSECDRCGHLEISYNSCRNRHCPKCQSIEQARWEAGVLQTPAPTGRGMG